MMMGLRDDYLKLKSLTVTPVTVREIKSRLGIFIRYMASLGLNYPGAIQRELMFNYRNYLLLSCNERSVHDRLLTILGFIYWLYRFEYLLMLPFCKEDLGKRPLLPEKVIPSEKEVCRTLDDDLGETRFPLRNLALFELLYGTGLRRAEAVGLNVSDVLGRELRIMGKGNVERIVPLGSRAKKAILAYISGERTPFLKQRDIKIEALFVSVQTRRICLGTVGMIFKEQIKTNLRPHQLRHACATHMLQRGCNVLLIQRMLGHKRLSTTQIYTHVSVDDLKRMLKEKHNRS